MPTSYSEFNNLFDIPYTLVLIIYTLAKYIITGKIIVEAIFTHCAANTCGGVSTLWRAYASWMVRVIFGGSDGISEGSKEQQNEPATETKKVYIEGKEVNGSDLDIIGVIILCFSLLLLLIMYSTYLLEVSFSCFEDPALYCFPRFVDDEDPDNPSINISERIGNCSDWDDLVESSIVTIQCFRYALNAQLSLVAGGGLIAIFTVSMRIIVSTIIKLYSWMGKYRCCRAYRKALWITAFIIIAVFNLGATTAIMVFSLIGQLEDPDSLPVVAELIASHLAEHGIQLIAILGTFELLLLIKWDKYETNADQQADRELDNV